LEIIDPNYEEKNEYKLKLAEKNNKYNITHEIQTNYNLLFEELTSESKIYHFYFSFGELNFIQYVNWDVEIKPFYNEIINLIHKPEISTIILGGHSIGSFVVQHLALKLINEGIDISKIFIVTTGCAFDTIEPVNINIIKNVFGNKCMFILSGYKSEDNIYVDCFSSYCKNTINTINTHLLLCERYTENNYQLCTDKSLKLIGDYDITKLRPEQINKMSLHDFSYYSKLYFT
jgi:hypothetical protein